MGVRVDPALLDRAERDPYLWVIDGGEFDSPREESDT